MNQSFFHLSRGICKGSANGPLTFSLYINDISETLDVAFIMYTDDIVIYCHGETMFEIIKTLKAEMLKIKDWCVRNHMSINYFKKNFMLFHKKRDNTLNNEPCIEEISMGNETIERVYEYKYLGVIFDPYLSFSLHYQHVMKVSQRLSYLRGFKRYFNSRILITMVNAHLHSIKDYALDIWAVQSDLMLHALQLKIDRFLCEFEYPTLSRSRKALSSVDLLEVRIKYDFCCLTQRRDNLLLNTVYNNYFDNLLDLSTRVSSRKITLIKVQFFNSETFRRSLDNRMVNLWNRLTKDIDIDNIGLAKFHKETESVIECKLCKI
ncbi:unnamed protein product [Orchesella dallaii]|uniref:Reverse transcriptase domain-containing protein n=1 Tax=Orchesella dallaii TaxID=48710 RepID=A0ABP1R4S1_9HEXA